MKKNEILKDSKGNVIHEGDICKWTDQDGKEHRLRVICDKKGQLICDVVDRLPLSDAVKLNKIEIVK